MLTIFSPDFSLENVKRRGHTRRRIYNIPSSRQILIVCNLGFRLISGSACETFLVGTADRHERLPSIKTDWINLQLRVIRQIALIKSDLETWCEEGAKQLYGVYLEAC